MEEPQTAQGGVLRPPAWVPSIRVSVGLQRASYGDELGLDLHTDLVSDQHAAGLERRIPLHVEVGAPHLGASRGAEATAAEGIGKLGSHVFDRQLHFTRGAVDREIARDFEPVVRAPAALRAERDVRKTRTRSPRSSMASPLLVPMLIESTSIVT